MRHSRTERWAPASGGAFALLLLAAFVVNPPEPARDASIEQLTTYYVDGAPRVLVSRVCAFLAAVALFWFSAALRTALRTTDSPSAFVPDVAFGAGVATAALLIVSGFPSFAAASMAEDLDPTSLQALFALDWTSHVPMVVAASLVLLLKGRAG